MAIFKKKITNKQKQSNGDVAILCEKAENVIFASGSTLEEIIPDLITYVDAKMNEAKAYAENQGNLAKEFALTKDALKQNKVFYGQADPTQSIGVNGDLYIQYGPLLQIGTKNIVWIKLNNSWRSF